MKQIKISNKWMQHKFMCSPEYISNVCKGVICCHPSIHEEFLLLPEEYIKFSYLINTKKCKHMIGNGLCELELAGKEKMFFCYLYPFKLNSAGTLILDRGSFYMKCHGQGQPVYKTNRKALIRIFGEQETNKITKHLETSDTDCYAPVSDDMYAKLMYYNYLKKLVGFTKH